MKRLIIGVIAGVALAGGVAYATIPDSGGVIHACMLKNLGTIRLVDPATGQKCSASLETAVDWNRQGPQGESGPAGPAGPKGDKGDQGERGPSELFHDNWDVDSVPLAPGTVVASLSLPAGSYLVTAQAEVLLDAGEPFPEANSRFIPYCAVWTEEGLPAGSNYPDLNGPRRFDIFELAGSATLTQPATLRLQCEPGSEIKMHALGQLFALRVGSLNQ